MKRAIILAVLVIIGGILVVQFDYWWSWANNLFDDQTSNTIEAGGTIIELLIRFGEFILILVFGRSIFEVIAVKQKDKGEDKTENQQNTAFDFPGA